MEHIVFFFYFADCENGVENKISALDSYIEKTIENHTF